MSEEFSPLTGFNGVARLFPLPNLVFFPQAMQPLHIFEPRYRQMTAEALAGDRLIAMVLLKPGWEAQYAGTPDLHSVGCLGKIVANQALPDGCFNILLQGLSRIHIDHEIPNCKLYRKARVELVAEVPIPESRIEKRLRKHLMRKVPEWFSSQTAVLTQFRKLLRSRLPLGPLCDILSFALPLDIEFKQELLAESEVQTRIERLIEHLESRETTAVETIARKFPPEFSVN